jgi:hypothetical protein
VLKYGFSQHFDIHGNTASTKTMLGTIIRRSDFEMNEEHIYTKLMEMSSIRSLCRIYKHSVEDRLSTLYGSNSLGALMQQKGFEMEPVGTPPFTSWGGTGTSINIIQCTELI